MTVNAGSTVDLNGFGQTIGSLAGSGTAAVTNSGGSDATLTAGGNNSSTSFAGVISDGGTNTTALIKTGSGTLTLSGANTYTGSTTINAGTLALSGTASIASSAGVDLAASGATFDISGHSGAPGPTIGDLSGVSGTAVVLGATPLGLLGSGNATTFAGTISGIWRQCR